MGQIIFSLVSPLRMNNVSIMYRSIFEQLLGTRSMRKKIQTMSRSVHLQTAIIAILYKSNVE
jgi:hypothetical protein